ncbi:MAG: hypothetical protein GSR85_07455 [Desulfurococcales archaeon]|nr:hypothetical protein [Desulfurococcales archaeon]
MEGSLDGKVSRILDSEISKIVEEIVYIDRRLAELGDGDEDEAERILLAILRRHLINDLMEIAGFVDEYSLDTSAVDNGITSNASISEEIRLGA